jgi:hypothetical protein
MRIGRAGHDTATSRQLVRAAWAILAVIVALVLLKLWLVGSALVRSSDQPWIQELLFQILPIPFAAVGALIAVRRPGHRIGWLLLIGSFSIACAQLAWGYGLRGSDGGVSLPGRPVIAWVGNWSPWPALAAFMLLLVWFPDGRAPSPRWRLLPWAIVTWTTVVMAFLALYPGLLSTTDLDNPFGLSGEAGKVMRRLQASPIVPSTGLGLFLVSATAPLLRFRRARAEQRLQLKWFAYAIGLLLLVLIIPWFPLPNLFHQLTGILAIVAVWGIAAAVGIAVLRYRLYDIDQIVSRTLVYGLLSALLAGVYMSAVLILGQLFGGVGGDPPSWVVAGATLAVAALFQPARRRIQGVVDRRFNRRKYDAARTVEAFSARLRDEVDLDALSAELLAVVDQTIQPTRASLWLRPSDERSLRAGT